MSSTNLDLVRSIFAAWERGDYTSSAWADPEMEFLLVGSPEPGTWKGLNEVGSFVRGYMAAWEEFRTEADEYRELDDERVLVLTHAGGRGQASGMEIGHQGGVHLFEIHQGKVMRLVFYWDRERAFADLGLAPEGDAPDQPG
jgi:ketosteroid isomerase-like protein